jgi:hypothetical protein
MNSTDTDDRGRIFGEVSKLVTIVIEGKKYQVPDQLDLLRCFQYLDFKIAFENFCWNASCENCAAQVKKSGEKAARELCCQVLASEGMIVKNLPEGVVATPPSGS